MALLHWAPITLGLTFALLCLVVQVRGTRMYKGESNPYQSVRLPAKTKANKFNHNAYTLSSVQRSHQFIPPIVSRWQPTHQQRTLTVPSYSPQVIASESTRHQRIVIPVGVSHYRPVQYVDSFNHEPLPRSYFDKVLASVPNKTAVSSETNTATNSTVAASSEVNEVKVSGGSEPSSDTNQNNQSRFAHPPRFIELESSYVPLTIRFPSRATRLNIIPGENDLVGQDSNRQDSSFGKRLSTDNDEKTRSLNLDSRVLFGETKQEEPLVLKEGNKSTIPSNMQRIIKCIFPDFHFDGEDQVQSAC